MTSCDIGMHCTSCESNCKYAVDYDIALKEVKSNLEYIEDTTWTFELEDIYEND